MCSRPKLIVNPQSKYLLHKGAIPYVCGVEYSPYEVLARLSVLDLLEPHGYTTTSAEDVLYIKDSSYLCVGGNRFPLFIALPCGRCRECRSDYRKEIENRALIEAANSGTVIFYTLTYDKGHLPKDGLCKSHVTSAFKRLRTHIARYQDFGCNFINLYVGEYGTDSRRTMRPHYHGLLFVEQQLTSAQLWELRKMFPFRNRSKFYEEHEGLEDFWPYGIVGDFQVARNPAALTRYVTKYITKQFYFADDPDDSFYVARERFQGHYNPCFVQLPKRFGLGTRHLHKYYDHILNSSDLSMRINIHGQVLRIGIPRLFIQKIFPTLGKVCPSARYHVALASQCVDKIYQLTHNRELYKSLLQRLDPYLYILKFDCKRREKRKLDMTFAFYHECIDVQVFLNLFERLMTHYLSTCFTEEEFFKNIRLKSEFYKRKVIPDTPYCQRTLMNHLKALDDVNFTKKRLVDSFFDRLI